MIDHVRDKQQKLLYRLSTVVDIPEFVKTAEQTTEEDLRELPPSAFAHPHQRLFPVHTEHDAWLSREYFHKFAEKEGCNQAGQIADRLDNAAELWQLPAYQAEKVATEVPDMVLKYRLSATDIVQELPVFGKDDFLKVAEDLLDNPGDFPYAMRKDLANQLLQCKHASELPSSTSNALHKTAANGIGLYEDAMSVIKGRRAYAVSMDKTAVELLDRLQAGLEKVGKDLARSDILEKTATALDHVDRLLGLNKKYNDTFHPPELSLFKLTNPEMQEFQKNAVDLGNGRVVHKMQLQDYRTRVFLRDCYGIETTVDNVLEKVASLHRSKKSGLLDFIISNA